MSSDSYSGLVMQELVQRKRKEWMTAAKVSSYGKTKQYLIPPCVEQLMVLPKSSVAVRIVFCNAWLRIRGIAQSLADLSWRPYDFRDMALGW